MTMQIGYFGRNSFVLASDRKRSSGAMGCGAFVSKVWVSEDKKLVAGSAGCDISRIAAKQIIGLSNNNQLSTTTQKFEEIGDALFKEYYHAAVQARPITEQPLDHVLVFDAQK